MATLHFICGKAGAGKTSLARQLGRTLPAIVICEDEWISRLGFEIHTVDDYIRVSGLLRQVLGPHLSGLLRLGVSVVIDFAANTVRGRTWVRSVFEAAQADHVLHVIEATDEVCLEGIHKRSTAQPEGVYFGPVSDEMFHAVTRYFAPPTPEEGFNVRRVVR
ncbi:MAG: ATP-binding protein [Myxococcota bacterium]|nr:ATP-binding protein [Myxococcota bacterium]